MSKFQSSAFSRSARPTCTSVLVAFILLSASSLFADGGTLRLSQHYGNYQISVFTSPAVLRAGPIDISVLVQDAATGQVRSDVPLTIQLQHTEQPNVTLLQPATVAAATNKLFRAALFDLPEAGSWRAAISIGEQAGPVDAATASHESAPLAFDLAIAPPQPPWLQLAPWVTWPIALVALFVWHQRLIDRRHRLGRAASPFRTTSFAASTHMSNR